MIEELRRWIILSSQSKLNPSQISYPSLFLWYPEIGHFLLDSIQKNRRSCFIFSISTTNLKLFFFNCIFSISPDPSHHRSESVALVAASVTAEPVVDDRGTEEVDYVKLAMELERASPLKVMDSALTMFSEDIAIAIAFSGVEDVVLIEYARMMGRPFMVFSLNIGRLNPETYQFFDTIEKHYNIHIKYMFPDVVEVHAIVRTKGEEGLVATAGAERPEGLGHRAVEGPVPQH